MHRLALVLALLAATSDAQRRDGRFERVNSRCVQGRTDRGLPCGGEPLFQFATASGAGVGAPCACAAVTGTRGEAVTFARTGSATCSPLGFATTGITTASLVECASGLPRVEPGGVGANGLRIEQARTNSLLRFIDFANATWADVATPTLTGAQPSPFSGTYANLGVSFDDNDAAAQEGRGQTVTVTAALPYTMFCYVRAGTLTSAAISLDGTTATITGLSGTTWSVVTVTDASSSGVAINAQALNGAAAADTGTVTWGGCQVEQGTFRTSIIPTLGSAVTRNNESASVAVTISGLGSIATTLIAARVDSVNLLRSNTVGDDTALVLSTITQGDLYVGGGFKATTASGVYSVGVPGRIAGWWSATDSFVAINGVPGVAGIGGSANVTVMGFGQPSGGLFPNGPNGIFSFICLDNTTTGCR